MAALKKNETYCTDLHNRDIVIGIDLFLRFW